MASDGHSTRAPALAPEPEPGRRIPACGPVPAARWRRWLPLPASLVAVALLAGASGHALFSATRPGSAFRPLLVDRVLAVDDLAPDGRRLSFVTESTGYAVGERADGRIGVSAIALLPAGRERRSGPHEPDVGAKRYVTPAPARLRSARLAGDWLVVETEPGADGKRRLLFVCRESLSVVKAIDPGDRLVFDRATAPCPERLGMFWVSPAAGTVRRVTVGVERLQGVVRDGPAYRLPPGARVAHRSDQTRVTLLLADGGGGLWRFAGVGPPQRVGRAPLPPGHPPALAADLDGADLLVAEDRPGYRVTRGDDVVAAGPAGRRPVWVGQCGLAECVVDELPGVPASRELAEIGAGGLRGRARVPDAVPDGALIRSGGRVLVPTASGGTVLVESATGRTAGPAARLLVVGAGKAVALPAPSGEARPVRVEGVELGADRSTPLGEPVIRSAGCAAAWGRLACPGEDDFTVWQVLKEVPYQ